MIFLFTDFGASDVYVGQVKARLARALGAAAPVIDLLHEAPAFAVRASAHLLAALAQEIAVGDVCIAVVDPGVGGARDAVALRAAGKWFVGPDNGLLSVVAARAQSAETFRVVWRPQALSASFHGRDLFAPVAAQLARGETSGLAPKARLDIGFGAADLPQIIFIDHYGNAMTALRGAGAQPERALYAAGRTIEHAPLFSAVALDQVFWYVNSIGLIEIACNQGNAAQRLGLKIGDTLQWH